MAECAKKKPSQVSRGLALGGGLSHVSIPKVKGVVFVPFPDRVRMDILKAF